MRSQEQERIRKDKRAKYIRERMAGNEELRLAHNLRMRIYRANKREELMRLREMELSQKPKKSPKTQGSQPPKSPEMEIG